MTRGLLAALAASVLTACSMLNALNPFSSSSKPKMAELTPIQASVELRQAWQASVGSARDYTFTPAIVGTSVFAAAYDGTIVRLDEGREAWRIKAEKRLSGGVGSDGALVAVGTPKGEVLAFDAATGNPLWTARASSEVLSPPAVGEGLVVVRSGDNRIYGFDASDGKRKWFYQRATPALSLRSDAGVRLAEKAVIAGFPGGNIPAHRVVNRSGLLTGKHHFPGSNLMQELLENEGVIVEDDEVQSFNEFFWDPNKELI